MKNNKIMMHIVAGYPSLTESEKVALLMCKCGVDFLEIQIPFSDPVADGPTIMAANQKALENGVKVDDCFRLMENLYKKTNGILASPKFLFMTYFNLVHHYGVEKFCKKTAQVGCYGLIIPDVPIDEEKSEKYLLNCKKYGLKPIQIISPLTRTERLKKIAKAARGFVYCVSRYGTTGQSKKLNPKLKDYLKKIKKYIKLPLAVGFGISNKAHVDAVWKEADIAVIGSKIINLIGSDKNYLLRVAKFLKQIKKRPVV